MKTIIVQGSSRVDGNSYQIAKMFQEKFDAPIINLAEKKIHPYSYEHHHTDDDFLPTLEEIVHYDTIVFITPVYWYSMSGIMKNFFDRITDCLKVHKQTGRKLRGMNMLAVSCGSDATQHPGFFIPFQLSAAYLSMNYLGELHTWISRDKPEKEVSDQIDLFANRVLEVAIEP
ncbi:flavodoxin family protein [Robertkochia flava]|uniref:flavodoxin family protein n=1 Tax=Robertkochia flava TaxID=3447986 RepID=UPI001CCFBD7F|nr:flavodoxin family protein [Robertkochia marina]